jgi:hypothetical protein
MTRKIASLLLPGLFVFVGTAQALEMKGVQIADSVKLGDKTLFLNGAGTRQKTFLNIDIYVGALYLETKSHDPEAILKSPEKKRVELVFVHSASQGQIQDAFEDSYKDSCEPECAPLKDPFSKLKAMMVALQVGDRLAFDIFPDKVQVWVKGQDRGAINNVVFAKAFLRTWLGQHPPTDSLKDAMLGK